MITQARLKELLHYDQETGVFTWVKTSTYNVKAGDMAGGPDDRGYIRIYVDGKRRKAHRLAWIYMFGTDPGIVDHINRNRSDNRISNLRPVTKAQNNANTSRAPGKHGRGVRRNGNGWAAQISLNGKRVHLGTFCTRELASAAYQSALAKRFQETA